MIYAAAYSGLILMIFAGGATLSVLLFVSRTLRGRPLLEMVPRRPVPWGFVDLLPMWFFLGLSAFAIIADQIISRALPGPAAPLGLEQAKQLLMWDTLFKVVLAVIMFGWIYLRHRPAASDWGWSLSRIREDAVIGGGTFLVIYLPTILLQVSLVYLLDWKYDHPLIELTTQTKDPLLFALAVVVAAIAAPLFEEFVFRGLLQGWLERVYARGATAQGILLGGDEPTPASSATTSTTPALGEILYLDPNPYASPEPVTDVLIIEDEPAANKLSPPSWMAIILSSVIFALLHFSHGPSWIPLLLFGAALGYVYQRTHSLWPGIVAHVLLNGTTMIGLWVQVFGGVK